MALTKGVNSYATVSEANSHLEDRLDVAAWTEAPEAQKAQALVTATSVIDQQKWAGYSVSASQELAHPRILTYFDPRLGRTVNTSATSVDKRVFRATVELAYHFLNNDGILDNSGEVKSISVGPINLQSIRPSSLIPSFVRQYIQPLLLNSGSNMVWRSN